MGTGEMNMIYENKRYKWRYIKYKVKLKVFGYNEKVLKN